MTLVVVGVKVTMLYKFKFYNAWLQKINICCCEARFLSALKQNRLNFQ